MGCTLPGPDGSLIKSQRHEVLYDHQGGVCANSEKGIGQERVIEGDPTEHEEVKGRHKMD